MIDVYYVNSKGEKLNLVEWPYRIQTGNLLDYEKSYTCSETSCGSEITQFFNSVINKKITLTVSAKKRAAYYDALDNFHNIVNYDIVNMNPGRLYFNGQYLRCYIFGSKKTEWEYDCNYLDNEISIVAGESYWIAELKKSFIPGNDEMVNALDYPRDYPHDYAPSTSTGSIINGNYMPADFRLTIFGPVVNPSVTIGNNVYKVYTELTVGEYLVIDSQERVVVQYDNAGNGTVKFNSREKAHEIYAQIPIGSHSVEWDGSFGFDLTLYQKRSEPRWSL